MNFIKNIDYLSYKAHFTFNEKGDKRYKTLIGGTLSLISIIISFSFICYFFYRFMGKQDASVIYSVERDSKINITYSHKLPFMFRLSDTYSIPLTTYNLYNITLLVWYSYIDSKTKELIQKYDNVIVEKCDINKHFGEYKKFFTQFSDINTYFCPKERLNNQTLYGIYGEETDYIYYVFYFSKCINNSTNFCLKNEDMDYLLSATFLDIKYMSYSVNSIKSKNTNTISVISDRYIVSNTVYKRIWLYFNKIKYITDNGFFFPSYKKEYFHQFDHLRIDVDLRNTTSNIIPESFLTIIILNNGNLCTYKKNYLKIQDYLATIGGIVKALLFICQYLNYFNATNSYYYKLIKDFFIENHIHPKNFSISDNNTNRNLDKSDGFIFKTLTFHNKSNFNQFKLENINKSRSLVFETLKQKDIFDSKIRTTFFPLILCTKSKQDKKEMIWYISNINKRLNIINILNTLEQINKISNELLVTQINNKDNYISSLNANYKTNIRNNFLKEKEIIPSKFKKI